MQYIYLIKSQEYYKIGVANDPSSRLAQLQTGNPHELEIYSCYGFDDAMAVERVLHQTFKNSRHFLEWFELSGNDVERFEEICAVIGGQRADEYLGQASNSQIEEAEEMSQPTDGGKWDYAAMFADGWRIERQGNGRRVGEGFKYWNWRKRDSGREYIYGGLIQDLPYPVEEMRKKYQTESETK